MNKWNTKQKSKKADQRQWNKLPESLKKRVIESLQQAETGYFVPNQEALEHIRKKYKLNV